MISREEILKSFGVEPTSQILNAMSEYAQQRAIDFVENINQGGYVRYKKDKGWHILGSIGRGNGSNKHIGLTTNELYVNLSK